jgi:hypothetical protein
MVAPDVADELSISYSPHAQGVEDGVGVGVGDV